ncbi:MAG: methyltransferase domain-containing protein [Acidobacteria bacterium]|nr:methyltransferase domain-containing protein [Acidobacteriota bacterium]
MRPPDRPAAALTREVRAYWNDRIHDLEMTDQPVGTKAFFDELDDYRFDKLAYLPKVMDFAGFGGQRLLEIGCGIGTDLVRFAAGGARVAGVDLSETAVRLARQNMALHGHAGSVFAVADGAALPVPGGSLDVVYAHGVLQYSAEPRGIVEEAQRVLRPGGTAIFMVYNRVSWLMALSKIMKVGLEHQDAPGLRLYSIAEFERLLAGFSTVRIIPERFPVKSRLHHGWKAAAYNGAFVGLFNALPRRLVRRFGWHLMAICQK